jgi:GH24 family phage-related lysozyme (muramidase)
MPEVQGEEMIDKIKAMEIRHEGKKARPYKCTQGFNTIGIGYNFDANPLPYHIKVFLKKNGYITDEMIDQLFVRSLGAAVDGCLMQYPRFSYFSENRRLALIDFMFNLGPSRVRKFVNTNKAINEGRWNAAAEGIRKSLYWKQLGGDPPGTDDGKLERPEEIYQMIKEG